MYPLWTPFALLSVFLVLFILRERFFFALLARARLGAGRSSHQTASEIGLNNVLTTFSTRICFSRVASCVRAGSLDGRGFGSKHFHGQFFGDVSCADESIGDGSFGDESFGDMSMEVEQSWNQLTTQKKVYRYGAGKIYTNKDLLSKRSLRKPNSNKCRKSIGCTRKGRDRTDKRQKTL